MVLVGSNNSQNILTETSNSLIFGSFIETKYIMLNSNHFDHFKTTHGNIRVQILVIPKLPKKKMYITIIVCDKKPEGRLEYPVNIIVSQQLSLLSTTHFHI